jgi:hypothetical protein
MKPNTAPRKIRLHRHTASLALTALLAIAATAQAQSDNFNNGTLTGWATSSSSNFPSTFSFVPDVYGGTALRLVATTAPIQTNGGLGTTPRAMVWETNVAYSSNFFVAADLVGWNTSTDISTNDPVIGLMARVVPYSTFYSGYYADPNIPVGQPDAVIFATRYNANGGTNSGTHGQAQIYWIQAGRVGAPLAQGDYTIDPGHSYRLVFIGTNTPDAKQYFFGYVYDLQDLTRPLLTLLAVDGLNQGYMPASGGYSGSTNGYMGLMGIGYRPPVEGTPPSPTDDYWTTNRGCDVTFDNFVASVSPPTSVSLPTTPYGLAALPQVVNRQPISWTNFYPAAGGISFHATTLCTTNTVNTNAIKLFLNGVDVSSGLSITGPTTNASVSYSGLASNTVYDARIELQDALGRKTTNVWTFDTFSDAFLAGTNYCKNIECEDYDFGGGLFIDNPPVSGFTSNTTFVQRFNTGFNTDETPGPGYNTIWPDAINSGSGYVNRLSVMGTDYFDYDLVGTLAPYLNRKAGDNQFNQVNGAGTTQGSEDNLYSWYDPSPDKLYMFNYDTQRQKYVNQDPNLLEYMLERTEGGEWYNYTRIFHSTNYYNVYLRHGCELTQPVSLDLIGAGTTKNLGTFYLTNALAKSNYRYAPLVTLATPPNSLILNGDFAANVLSFTVAPGYIGGSNPSSITSWTGSGTVQYGINGPGTSVGSPFSPINSGGLTYAFLQGTGQALVQSLTTLAPNTTYQLVYSVAGRAGNTASYRVIVYLDNTFTTTYYDSGVQPANSSGFVTVTASFSTPATLGAAPNIQLGNSSVAGDNTVDYANVFLVPGSSPVTSSSQLAVVNLSGTNTLRLTIASPQGDATKQGLSLNYMAFVPAFVVLSSSQVETGYALDTTASINQATKTITIPQSGPARFYRLRWDHQVTIKSITLVGGNVVLTYQ